MKKVMQDKVNKNVIIAIVALIIAIIAVVAIHEAHSTDKSADADSSAVSVSTTLAGDADVTSASQGTDSTSAASRSTTTDTAETTVLPSNGSKFTQEEIERSALNYFLANTSDALSRDSYSVGVSDTVPAKYEGKGYVTVEIRHVNNGNNTLDARYYINESTLGGYDDAGNAVSLT